VPLSCSIAATCHQVIPQSFGNVVTSLPPEWVEHSAPARCRSRWPVGISAGPMSRIPGWACAHSQAADRFYCPFRFLKSTMAPQLSRASAKLEVAWRNLAQYPLANQVNVQRSGDGVAARPQHRVGSGGPPGRRPSMSCRSSNESSLGSPGPALQSSRALSSTTPPRGCSARTVTSVPAGASTNHSA
jgi:hypothetical protein